MDFSIKTRFQPTGDQPQAIEELTANLKAGAKYQVLLGVTGSGKTATMSWVIEKMQRPVLVISPNKTLCAQLFQEFKDFFPKNGVHYFVSYYDYYQPEAYIPQTDTYIEKDADINEEIDRLRHAAVQDVLTRRDVIVVASVSCIYNIGSPEGYQKVSLQLKEGQQIKRRELLNRLTGLQYQRNEIDFKPGTFRVRGEAVEIFLVTGDRILRLEMFGDKIDKLLWAESGISPDFKRLGTDGFRLFPAHFWATPQEKMGIALQNIGLELQEQLKILRQDNKLLEAQRLESRTNYDLDMMREAGFCSGIENYSRHLEFREPGEAPYTLMDYFPEDFLVLIDESHQTLPQIRAMAVQDKARKEALIRYGFRLPSALDNRPLKFSEFEEHINQAVYVSATPGKEEMERAASQGKGTDGKKYVVEQLIRPTGLLEPTIEIRPTENQVKDLVAETKKRKAAGQRVLALTLTKRLAEALSEYLSERGLSCQWLHSEVKTLERPGILKELRKGKYDVLVGINLLREGLDLPEVALVAILDADKEGFLRSKTTLIQIMGRASRHPEGHVILYADSITRSMRGAMEEIERRRKIQEAFNREHHITPKPIVASIKEWPFVTEKEKISTEFWMVRDKNLLKKEMRKAAKELNFERAAEIRDLIRKLEKKED
jgi:excinuclease ABC subunit B